MRRAAYCVQMARPRSHNDDLVVWSKSRHQTHMRQLISCATLLEVMVFNERNLSCPPRPPESTVNSCAICNPTLVKIRRATRTPFTRHVTLDMRHATCDMRHAMPNSTRHATCTMPRATCDTPHTSSRATRHAPIVIRHTKNVGIVPRARCLTPPKGVIVYLPTDPHSHPSTRSHSPSSMQRALIFTRVPYTHSRNTITTNISSRHGRENQPV